MKKIIIRLSAVVFSIIILAVAVLIYSTYIEPFWIKTTELSVQSDKLQSENNSVKIAFFADTHFGEYFSVEDFEKTIEKINESRPDIIIFGGDLIDSFDSYRGNLEDISNGLSRLEASHAKYAVYGNHDYGGGAENEYEKIMNQGGFQVLINQNVTIPGTNLVITGIDDFLIGHGDVSCTKNNQADDYNLVVCHEPDIVDYIIDSNVDFMIAGHTHAGQIRIPTLTKALLPQYGKKYIQGEYSFSNQSSTTLYVSSGIGMTKLPMRLLARPEITIVTLEKVD